MASASGAGALVVLALALFATRIAAAPKCPYVHETACAEPTAANFLSAWRAQPPKGSREVLEASGNMLEVMSNRYTFSREWPLPRFWFDTCLSGYLLALYITSKGASLHSWVIYELGVQIIATCDFDEGVFFSLFGITPTQIAYVIYLLSYQTLYPHHMGNPWNPAAALALKRAQVVESGGALRGTEDETGMKPFTETPFVVDIGMGLGADSRYYLSHDLRVIAVEANPSAIQQATADPWLQPFLLSGELVVLHAAIVAGSEAGGFKSFQAYGLRPEQSRTEIAAESQESAEIRVLSIECSEIPLKYGRPGYMKIDVEEQTVLCIDSLHRAFVARGQLPPRLLSFEVENTGLLPGVVAQLHDMGYAYFKVVRQSVYSPGPCEIGEGRVLGCGSGPFGDSAVDYLYGLRWRNLTELVDDLEWQRDWGANRDWFDVHVKAAN